MQIDFASSGGFANLELNYRGDTNTMPEEQAKELERLIESSGLFDLEQEDATPQPRAAAGPPDVIAYRLTISDGARQSTLWLNDVTAPAAVRPLLAFLRKLAIEEKRQGGQTS
ncbi:MAG TPA: protealysin inhibitor emfourin [Anaerolineales bacterium]|nr:protealysin inhibitor emfourin [Anaerolineales bacterium]